MDDKYNVGHAGQRGIRKLHTEDRGCGDCRLCCKLLAVGREGHTEDFQKPQGVWCEHCGSKASGQPGCLIYDTRPPDCEKYACVWMRGIFDERDRPDKVRIVVSLEYGDGVYDSDGREIIGPTAAWCVYEGIVGVTQKKRGQAILKQLETLVVEVTPGQFEGPFPICVIPSVHHTRRMKAPWMKRWIPLLRPGEHDPLKGHVPALKQK